MFYKSDDEGLSFGVTEETRCDYGEEITVRIPEGLNKHEDLLMVRAMLKTGRERKGQDFQEIEIEIEIRTEVTENNEDISPTFVETDIQRCVELVSDSVLAVLARGRGVRVIQVPTERSHKFSCPVLAGLARWRLEHSKLVALAVDNQAATSKGLALYFTVRGEGRTEALWKAWQPAHACRV